MNWDNFNTYGDDPRDAFETFTTQLFERHLQRTFSKNLQKFRVINSDAGDGGIEAYGEVNTGELIAVQAKWFRDTIEDTQIRQIRKSIDTALGLRKNISQYIICLPRKLASLKYGRGKKGQGKKPTSNDEGKRIDKLLKEVEAQYPNTEFTLWTHHELEKELSESNNEGIHKYWFEGELITLAYLQRQFELQKASWLRQRYIPALHGQGIIQEEIQQLLINKDFRDRIYDNLKATIQQLRTVSELAIALADTIPPNDHLHVPLGTLAANAEDALANFLPVIQAILNGATDFAMPAFIPVALGESDAEKLDQLQPSDRQRHLKERLTNLLQEVTVTDLNVVVQQLKADVQQTSRLFLGRSGTGKTHALSNTVDEQLNTENAPAIIIRAKGTPCSHWTYVLKSALELEGWDRDQILSALETLATRTDRVLTNKLAANEELNEPPTKVVICIDGLEEDTLHWTEWYYRMGEAMKLMESYPRLRFVYTARNYFLNGSQLPKEPGFQVKEIPLEGDIPVAKIIDQYFSPEHYNITVEPKTLIRGINSLQALRLFCELYEGRKLTGESDFEVAEGKLLERKVELAETEFKVQVDLVTAEHPVRRALNALADLFYEKSSVPHDKIVTTLQSVVGFLSAEQIEELINYFTNNGFIVRDERPVGKSVLANIEITYTVAQESIMETIMADAITEQIISEGMTALPEKLTTRPAEADDGKSDRDNRRDANKRIIQQIVNKLFYEHGRLIGDNGFLGKGISDNDIETYRIAALIQAPLEVAEKYRDTVASLFLKDHRSRAFVFRTLIYPSAISSHYFFGANFLHQLLVACPSAFERELVWLGWDSHSIHELDVADTRHFYRYDLCQIIDPEGSGDLFLSDLALYDEMPLVFGWALATLDQSLRERLRLALTKWGLAQPEEFKLLLDKLFFCNDPQIQEDLASVVLGLAAKLRSDDAILLLAKWTLENVFSDTTSYRDLIVREGFRAIVEKAYSRKLVTMSELINARPPFAVTFKKLQLDIPALSSPTDEFYPIVHDLAWYVIKRAFDDFLDYETVSSDDEPEDNTSIFLKGYLTDDIEEISTYSWAMSAIIAYMKNLGFSRTDGNNTTDATHGSKSKHFTLEEKYTWLAVHFLQGYLSDYLPLKDGGLVQSYMEIVNVPNPAEFISLRSKIKLQQSENNWLIKETLAPEMSAEGSPDDLIDHAVDAEPAINWQKWLQFPEKDLLANNSAEPWLALFNYTNVSDSKMYIAASIDARGVLIDRGQLPHLRLLVHRYPDRSHFVEHIDRMVGSPATDTYSNPSDVVWMDWIGESNDGEDYYPIRGKTKRSMKYTLTSVTKNTVSGEQEIYIPSKTIRDFLAITELDDRILLTNDEQVRGVLQFLQAPNYNRQEMVLVPQHMLLKALKDHRLELVWFVDLYRRKDALNKTIKSDRHAMKTRKYIVYFKDGVLTAEKFWDARFSNQRDKDMENNNKWPIVDPSSFPYDEDLPDVRGYNDSDDRQKDEDSDAEPLLPI